MLMKQPLTLLAAFALTYECGAAATPRIDYMRCEYLTSPIGIDAGVMPRFTWTYTGDSHFVQSTCLVELALSRDAFGSSDRFVWQSPAIKSPDSYVRYDGKQALNPLTRYYWRVVGADRRGRRVVSAIDSFETAFDGARGWKASWISDALDKEAEPAPMLRRAFTAPQNVREARLYVSAAAYARVTLNGENVTINRMEPGYTHYDKRNLYGVYDVTRLVQRGAENVLAAVVGNGFYNENRRVATWEFEKASWRGRARMICELHLIGSDGSRTVICSDGSWKTATGPYVRNNIYSGDTYDARFEPKGWRKAGFDDSGWRQATEVVAPSTVMALQTMPGISTERELKPVSVQSFGDTVFVYDFGENMAGVTRLEVEGECGTNLKIVHGELLKKSGRVEIGNIDIYFYPMPGYAFQTDEYTLRGDGRETFTPEFTYHGFRYAEVRSDRPIKLGASNLTALCAHTAVEPIGKFSCSNELLNTIWATTNRTYLANLMSIPTDCPQREKNGWTADAHTAMDIALLNFDGITFYEKWINDFVDNQHPDGRIAGIIPSAGWGYSDWIGPVWDAAMFIIPNTVYNYYGTQRAIETIYPTCEKYLNFLKTREDKDGCVTYGIGDWVPYNTKTPTEYTSSCFYYYDQVLMARFARLLGRDASAYERNAEELKATINRIYFHADSSSYANGSQAAQAVALALGLVPEAQQQKVADRLNSSIVACNYHLDFGMLGSKFALRMLTKYGHLDTVYRMITQEDCPSWGWWIKQGFTTLAETWALSPEFRDASVNHVFLGDVSAWMYNMLAGINFDPEQPGFRHIVIRPNFPSGLDWVKGEYRSVNGMIRSEWVRDGRKARLTVTIPDNTTATVEVGSLTKRLGAGVHTLTVRVPEAQ